MTYFEQLNELKDYRVYITCKYANIDLIGIINEESLSLPFSASFSGSLAAQIKEGSIKGVGQAILNKIFGSIGNALSPTVSTMGSSIKTYQNGADISISFSCYIFPNKDGNPSSKEILYQIAKMTQPKEKSNVLYSALYNPIETKKFIDDYKAFDNELICISIGNWFKKCGLFCQSANTEISTILTEDGEPLYIKANFTFIPYRMQTFDDINKMINFKG